MLTGASGFIGSHLLPALEKQFTVTTLKRSDAKDTASVLAKFESEKPDLVIHLASYFKPEHRAEDISPMLQSNLEFGTQVLEGMKASGCKRIINTGTFWQHYQGATYDPVCLYAATKQAFEEIARFYVNACGFQVLTLKLSDTYGPGDPRRKLLSLLKEQAKSAQGLGMSPGDQEIDLLHVDDVISGFVRACAVIASWKDGQMENFGLSSGSPLPLKQLVKLVEKISGKDLKIQWGGRPYRAREVMETWKDYRPLPGWEPRVSLESGIREFLNV